MIIKSGARPQVEHNEITACTVGVRLSDPGTEARVFKTSCSGTTETGMHITHKARVRVEECHLHDHSSEGLRVDKGGTAEIIKNKIRLCKNDGIVSDQVPLPLTHGAGAGPCSAPNRQPPAPREVLEWPYTIGRGGVPPLPPFPRPKGPSWEKTKFTKGEIWSGHFWCTNFLVPDPPSPRSNTSLPAPSL